MKHVAFKKVPLKNPNTGNMGELDYKAYCELAIRQPLDGKAIGLDEMRSSIRLLDAMEKSDEKGVDFEDTDFEFFVKKVNALRFTWVDPVFAKFIEDVTNGKGEV